MGQYAVNTSVSEAVGSGGLLVVAQWEAKEGQADRIADILSRFEKTDQVLTYEVAIGRNQARATRRLEVKREDD